MEYTHEQLIEIDDKYGAHNYKPLDVVISKGKGVWVWDVAGNKYMDMLSSYSALNHGHCNPKIIEKVMGWTLGKIELGALADIILIDYIPPTILNEKNFLGHLLFGLVNAPVDTTICNGKIIMEGKRLVGLDESVIAKKTSELASRLWERLEAPDTILHG